MRTTIDAAGRLVVPKALREELGLVPGTQIELEAVDGHLEIQVPSLVHEESHGGRPVFVADDAPPLTADAVRDLMERSRR